MQTFTTQKCAVSEIGVMESFSHGSESVGFPDCVSEASPDIVFDVDKGMPITSKLKSLRKGDSVTFPIERRQSVYAVANRLRKELVKWAWNFKLVDNTENFTVTIVRIS